MFAPRVLSYGRVRTIQAVVASFLAVTTVLFMVKVYTRRPPPSIYDYTEGRTSPWRDWNDTAARPATEEVAYLRRLQDAHGLTREMPWFARRIHTSFGAGKRRSMTESPAAFMPRDFTRARVDDENLALRTEGSIRLAVHRSARPDQIDASGLLFGTSSTFSRLAYANFSLVQDWERWLTDCRGSSNGAGLLVDLHGASAEEQARVSRILRERGVEAAVFSSGDGSDTAASRYAGLLGRLKSHNDELGRQGRGKAFLALVDDDVFFASMARLLAKLARFSPRREFYIGAPSEKLSDWVAGENATVTYGGGAVFLTPPMADRLAGVPCLQRDRDRREAKTGGGAATPWDEHLYRCVTASTGADFHVLPSFYSPADEAMYGAPGAAARGTAAACSR